MSTELIEKLSILHKVRADLARTKDRQKELLDKAKADPEYVALEKATENYAKALDELDAQIREQAIADYLANQNKKPGNGIEIKIFKVATILDPEHAREWCMTNFRPALKLDETMLRKTAIEGAIPSSVVSVTQEPRAQIATDLSEFVPNPLICQVTGKLKTECTGDDCDCIPF